MNPEGFEMLLVVIAIAAFIGVVLLYRRYRLDLFRARLFRLRDQLFDVALDTESGVRFDSPAYREIESALCANLRFAHLVNLPLVVTLSVFRRRGRSRSRERLRQVARLIRQIPNAETRKVLSGIWWEIPWLAFQHLMMSSFLFFAWALISYATAWAREIARPAALARAVFDIFRRGVQALVPRVRQSRRRVHNWVYHMNEPTLDDIELAAYRDPAPQP